MKFFTTNFIVSRGCTAMLLLTCSCSATQKPLFKDENDEVIEKGTVNYLNVHASRSYAVLKIFGKSFEPVRGWKPYYLKLPDTNLILFVTGLSYDNGQATVHIANLATRKVRSFPAHDSHIGSYIRSGPESNNFERVKSFDGRKLVVEARFLDNCFIHFLNLEKLEFEKEIAAYPFSPTKTTNVYEYTHGFSTRHGESVAKELHGYDLNSLPR